MGNYDWRNIPPAIAFGLAFDAGIMLHFDGFGFSLGVQTIHFNYLEAKIGIGYTLKY